MVKVQYHGPHDAVLVRDLDDREVRRGETIDVPDELGERLLEQPSNWERPAAKAARANP